MNAIAARINRSDVFTVFLVKILSFFICWWCLYNLLIVPHQKLDNAVIHNQVTSSGFLLEAAGYPMTYKSSLHTDQLNVLFITGSEHSLQVAPACNSVNLMGLFAVFVLAYPGKRIHRLWLIPAGILLIHFTNIVRIASLAIIQFQHPQLLDFNHKYTFSALMYLFIFGMWYVWVRFFGIRKVENT